MLDKIKSDIENDFIKGGYLYKELLNYCQCLYNLKNKRSRQLVNKKYYLKLKSLK